MGVLVMSDPPLRFVRIILMPYVLHADTHAVFGEHNVLLLHLLLAAVRKFLSVEVDLSRNQHC